MEASQIGILVAIYEEENGVKYVKKLDVFRHPSRPGS
jgi:hypothetical protein